MIYFSQKRGNVFGVAFLFFTAAPYPNSRIQRSGAGFGRGAGMLLSWSKQSKST